MTNTVTATKSFKRTCLAVTHGAILFQAEVSNFPRVTIGTRVQFTVQNQACAKPRTERHKHHIFASAPCAVLPFRKRTRVRIVL